MQSSARAAGKVNQPWWHEETINRLRQFFSARSEIQAALLFGSTAREDERRDEWSDIDIAIIVEDAALNRYFPDVAWIEALGPLYIWEQSEGALLSVTRCCFRDGKKIDFVFVPVSALLDNSAEFVAPWGQHARILF